MPVCRAIETLDKGAGGGNKPIACNQEGEGQEQQNAEQALLCCSGCGRHGWLVVTHDTTTISWVYYRVKNFRDKPDRRRSDRTTDYFWAERPHLFKETKKSHVARILRKMGVRSRRELLGASIDPAGMVQDDCRQ